MDIDSVIECYINRDSVMSYIGATILTYIGYVGHSILTDTFQVLGMIGGFATLSFGCLRMFEMWRYERAKRKKEEKDLEDV